MTSWQTGLPPEYQMEAVPPLRFENFRDEEARAEKVLGYDNRGEVCYYRHAYSLRSDFLDDDDLYGENEVFFEIVTAWRQPDGRWLTCLRQGGEQGSCGDRLRAPSYAMADERPR